MSSIGPVPIVRNASLDLDEGEMCGLIGRNGAGKTTFLRALMGALPARGRAMLGDVDLRRCRRIGRARHRLHAGGSPSVPQFTVEENIRLPTWSVTVDGAERRLKWIYSIMPEVERFRTRRALELSGGQQKMVALARALMGGTASCCSTSPSRGSRPRSRAGLARSSPISRASECRC